MIQFIPFKRGGEQTHAVLPHPIFQGNSFLPAHAIIPFSFRSGISAFPIVSKGDFVREGQCIARAANSDSVHVYASVPGIVEGFVTAPLSDGESFSGLHIRTGGRFSILGKRLQQFPWKEVDRTQLLCRIKHAGIVNTAGEPLSLVATLQKALYEKKTTITAILYDKDPTCCLDSFLAKHFLSEILEGIAIAAQAFGAEKIILEHSPNKRSIDLQVAAQQFFSEIPLNTISVPSTYPVETNQILHAEKNSFVLDAVTALSIYECIIRNEPMITRYILLTGKTIEHSSVLKVRIGTPIGSIIEECGGFKCKTPHIVLNGLLQGFVVDSLDMPIANNIKAIYAMGTGVSLYHPVTDCRHCGKCLQSCPKYIDPIYTACAITQQQYTADVLHSIDVCRLCGCCSSVCPARIPLSSIIKKAKKEKNAKT